MATMKCKKFECSNQVELLPEHTTSTQMTYCSRECAPFGYLSSGKERSKENGKRVGQSNKGRKKKAKELNSTPLWLLEWRMKKAEEETNE